MKLLNHSDIALAVSRAISTQKVVVYRPHGFSLSGGLAEAVQANPSGDYITLVYNTFPKKGKNPIFTYRKIK